MQAKKSAYDIIDDVNANIEKAVDAIYNSDEEIIRYVLKVGVNQLLRQRRHKKRKVLHNTIIRPQFVSKPGCVTGSVVRSRRQQIRLNKATSEIWAEYNIRTLNLGSATKEDLVAEEIRARACGRGHFREADFIKRLHTPLKTGQRCPEYWTPRAVDLIREEIWRDADAEKENDRKAIQQLIAAE